MKRLCAFVALVSLLLWALGGFAAGEASLGADRLISYRDIPGVTAEEINEIEALKAERGQFSFGAMPSTEAFVQSGGAYGGFTPKLCAALDQLFGIPFVLEQYDWEALKDGLDAGRIDFTADLSLTPERMMDYNMTDAIAERSMRIVTRADSAEIHHETDVNGMRLGVLRGVQTVKMIRAIYPSLTFESVDVSDFEEALTLLESGAIDALVMEEVSDAQLRQRDGIVSKAFFSLVHSPVSLATAEPALSPILSVINKYLAAGGDEWLHELYQQGELEYAAYKLSHSLTGEERAFLDGLSASGGKVKTGFENDNYPISFYNKAEQAFQGIAVDVLDVISAITGIEFELAVEKDLPWYQILSKLETGEISLVTQLIESDQRSETLLWGSVPYSSSHYALLSKLDLPALSAYQVPRSTVGTIIRTAYEDKYSLWFAGSGNTIRYPTHSSALDALERGEVELLMASEYTLRTQTNYRENSGYKVNLLFDVPLESKFGYAPGETALRSIIDKAQAYVDVLSIETKWMNRLFDYSKVYAAERANILIVSTTVMLVLLVGMTVLLINNMRLSKNLEGIVEKRTRQLRHQTATLTAIYHSIPDLVFCKDANCRYTSCNESFEKFAGISEAELLGKVDADVFDAGGESVRRLVGADKLITGCTTGLETVQGPITYPDGTVKQMETIKAPLIEQGVVVGMLGISRDVTRRVEAEASLSKRLKQQSLMATLSQNFIEGGDNDDRINKALQMAGEFLDINRILLIRYEDGSLNYPYEWINGRIRAQSYLHGVLGLADSEIELVNAFAQRRVRHYSPVGNDLEMINQRYNLTEAESFLMIPIFVSGDFWGFLEFCQSEDHEPWSDSDVDLGEMIAGIFSGALTRQAIEMNLLRMSALVNSSPQYIAYINREGGYEFFNRATLDITGYTEEELIKGGVMTLHGKAVGRTIIDEVLPRIQAQGSDHFELPLIRKDGAERIMSFSAFSIPSDEFACGTIASDVTEQKHLETQLIKAKELAEHHSQTKSEFLSRMSHEMRTPMNAIIGMTKIAKTSDAVERKDYCLDKIDTASKHLLGVINDVLDMSKIEAGKFELSPTDFILEKMLIKVTNVINFRMEEKELLFSVKIGDNVPQAIVSDEQRLSQVVTNLLGNAVKFTPKHGSVSLSVDLIGEANGGCTLRFEVKDTGIGIAPDQQKRLFTQFEQADGSISRKYGGTGLGLAISKNIVEMMNGRIWVESKVGEGSSFLFEIRAPIGQAAMRSHLNSDINWANLRVLAVDDDPDVLEYFQHIAKPLGFTCEVAGNGEDALRMTEDSAPYNIIFVDWRMPEMDGIELTRRIKARFGNRVIVIMISATEWSHIEDDANRAGVDRFIAKPLFSSIIVDCINECLSIQGANAPVEDRAQEDATFAGKRILLAEDVEINREIVIKLLEPTQVTIECAENGQIAYDMFKADPTYDMIFMDIHMPEVSGYESARMIRALPMARAKAVPIIAMTANVFREDVEKCLAAGMNGHLGKPLDLDEIMDTLKEYLNGDQSDHDGAA